LKVRAMYIRERTLLKMIFYDSCSTHYCFGYTGWVFSALANNLAKNQISWSIVRRHATSGGETGQL